LKGGARSKSLSIRAERRHKTEKCPLKVAVFLPVKTSQRRTVLSCPPEARVLPSGLKTNASRCHRGVPCARRAGPRPDHLRAQRGSTKLLRTHRRPTRRRTERSARGSSASQLTTRAAVPGARGGRLLTSGLAAILPRIYRTPTVGRVFAQLVTLARIPRRGNRSLAGCSVRGS
jgi:hypothetical protein